MYGMTLSPYGVFRAVIIPLTANINTFRDVFRLIPDVLNFTDSDSAHFANRKPDDFTAVFTSPEMLPLVCTVPVWKTPTQEDVQKIIVNSKMNSLSLMPITWEDRVRGSFDRVCQQHYVYGEKFGKCMADVTRDLSILLNFGMVDKLLCNTLFIYVECLPDAPEEENNPQAPKILVKTVRCNLDPLKFFPSIESELQTMANLVTNVVH